MSYYNYLVIALEVKNKRWEFRVLNTNVDVLYGEEYDEHLSDKWTKLLEQIEMDFGILDNGGDDEEIVLTSAEIDPDDYPTVADRLHRFWVKQGYATSEVSYIVVG